MAETVNTNQFKNGMHIELDRVPLRATGMTPAEILSSESQERMCAVVTPENVDAFLAVCRARGSAMAAHAERLGHRLVGRQGLVERRFGG